MLRDFETLEATDTVACDHFFERWGAGNAYSFDRQLERFIQYESLLHTLQTTDAEKYKIIHKGTPYYFLGWLSFDLRNYEAATFYMSAALAEDRRIRPGQPFESWTSSSAGSFMLLRQSGSATPIITTIRDVINDILDRFNATNPSINLSIDDIINKFVQPMLENGHYSIVTSLYSFILEYRENFKNLSLTSGSVDSTEPVLSSLLKGALIFETIVKHFYPKRDGTQLTTLDSKLNTQTNFRSDFSNITLSHSDNTLQAILDSTTGLDYKTVIENTLRIRNTTGHRLLWDNIFNEPDNYKRLFEQETFATLYVMSKQQ